MKHKVLKSVAHNFTHSFVSFNNYVDDGFVVDDLRTIVRRTKRVIINWIPEGQIEQELTPRVLKSIHYWRESLPALVSSMGSDIILIQEFRTEIYLKENYQIAVEGILTDKRGRVYVAQIFDF